MILIVDDKPENLFSLRKLLEVNKFIVDTASSGQEALRKILRIKYSLVILDVQMPEMDGFEVAESITGYTKTKDIPIIFLSAVNIDKQFITKGYSSGAIDYVTKPFDPDIFLLKVKTFIKLHLQKTELNIAYETLKEEIANRKKAEKALLQSFSQLQSILETIPQIAFTLQPGGIIEYVNKHWLDYSSSYSVFPDTPAGQLTIKQIIKNSLTENRAVTIGLEILQLSSRIFRHHLLSLTPIKKDEATVKWVGMFTDIHDQKIATNLLEEKVLERTQELQKLNSELKTSNHALQQFTSVASHDLKEPLRKIQVFSNLLLENSKEESHQSFQYAQRINYSSKRMTSLIDDLLNYASLSAETIFVTTNIKEIIEGILSDMEISISEKKCVIQLGDMPTIEAIPSLVRQLFQNLISNSIKFSRTGIDPVIKITSEYTTELSATSPPSATGSHCRFFVTDNGIGFPEKYKEKIFSIFQRLHTDNKIEGTGVGLAIVKKVIEKHNGLIIARGCEQIGASFCIVLPLKHNT